MWKLESKNSNLNSPLITNSSDCSRIDYDADKISMDNNANTTVITKSNCDNRTDKLD